MLPRALRRAAGLIWLVAVVSSLPIPPAAAECPDYAAGPRWVGVADVSGSPDDIVIRDSYAYAAWGTGFAVFDLANPIRPTLLGSISAPGWANAVDVSGNVACLAVGVGLSVVDISDPAQPILTGSVDTFGRGPQDVAISGNYAYVADGLYGSSVVDISAPAAPKLLKGVDTPGYDYGIDVQGSIVFVAAGTGGLWIFDFSTPTRPWVVGSLDTPGDARSIDVVGDHAFIADGTGLQVIDLADRAHPTLVASVSTPKSGFTNSVTVRGDEAFVAGSLGLTVVDVAVPRAPRVLGWAAVQARAVAISGPYAYVGGFHLEVFDVSNPIPDAIPTHELLIGCVADITVAGSHAYVAEGSYEDSGCDPGLRVVDLSDPAGPRLVGSFDMSGNPGQIAIADSFAYVCGAGGLQVWNVSDPAQPRLAGSLNIAPGGGGVAVAGSFAYVTDVAEFHVVDVSIPSAPVRIGGVAPVNYARAVVVLGSHAYVTVAGDSLVVIDVANPALPAVVGSLEVSGKLAIAGSYLYAANRQDGFVAIDISNPAAPAVVGGMSGYFTDVAIAGSLAYVTNDYGLILIDISDPTSPAVAGAYSLVDDYSGYWSSVAVDGSSVCVSRGDYVCVLPPPCGTTPVLVTDLRADACDAGIVLRWQDGGDFVGFDVLRADAAAASDWQALGLALRAQAGWEFVDASVIPGANYAYRIEGQRTDGSLAHFGPVTARAGRGLPFALDPVRPLPARGSMRLSYTLPRAESVRLEVYDARGHLVRLLVATHQEAGRHTVTWDGLDARGSPAGCGVYFVRLSWLGGTRVARAALLR